MEREKITISGTGCALADFLYTDVSFSSSAFKKYRSVKDGDGGLSPGRLVFTEELEKFAGCNYRGILRELTGGRPPDGFNVGGPSLVSLIHASQMLDKDHFSVRFFGTAGKDDTGEKIFSIVRKTPLNIDNYLTTAGKESPFTHVLSDPKYDSGHGERTFVNNIGAAWEYKTDFLNSEFYDSDIICLGGTALVPGIHDEMTSVLKTAKSKGCITLVNTVFDFRNEKSNPGKPWPVGKGPETFEFIDILIMDRDEALKISGTADLDKAAGYFINCGASSFIITNGVNDLYAWSEGSFFGKMELKKFPVSQKVTGDLKANPDLRGDTTGCGDNFAGGVIASVALQMQSHTVKGKFDLIDAVSWGIASGGFCCYTLGGTFIEKFTGEKRELVGKLQSEYLKQIGG